MIKNLFSLNALRQCCTMFQWDGAFLYPSMISVLKCIKCFMTDHSLESLLPLYIVSKLRQNRWLNEQKITRGNIIPKEILVNEY